MYYIALSVALFAVGIAGVVTSRHLVVILLSIEIIFAASTIAAVSFFSFLYQSDVAIILLLSIWGVAAAEVNGVIVFYVYLKRQGAGFDVSKMNQLRW